MNKKLGKSLGKFYDKKANVQETLYGELGIPVNGVKRVDVPGRPGYVYVRLRGNNSELVQAYNSAVPTKYDYPVIVLRKKNTYTILGRDQGKYSNMGNIGQTVGFTPLPNHGGQHSFNPSLGMGADPVWVFSQQFMPQLIYPSGSSMLLAVSPHFYEWEGQWKYPQTTTPSFAPYVPTATGSARMALLFMDGDTGALNIVGGVGFSGGINNAADLAQYIPDIDRNNSIPLAAVKLGTGTTAIEWNNIYDMRDFYTVSKYFQGIGVQDSGVPAGTGHILNFGNNLAVTFAGNVATVDATAGGGGGGIGFVGWNEGVFLGTGTILNFVGDWVDASISGTVVQVRVTGSASTVPIIDSGGYYTGTSVELALQELGIRKSVDVFGGHGNGGTVPATTTYYIVPMISGLDTAGRSYPIPQAGTIKNLRFRLATNQPASGSLVITIYDATALASTGISITIPAGSVAGTYSNLLNAYSHTAGNLIQVQVLNNASSASGVIGAISFEIESFLR